MLYNGLSICNPPFKILVFGVGFDSVGMSCTHVAPREILVLQCRNSHTIAYVQNILDDKKSLCDTNVSI